MSVNTDALIAAANAITEDVHRGIGFSVRALAVGGSFLVIGPADRLATVKRVRRNVYSLTPNPAGVRNRWGTAAEITDDACHWFDTGRLPPVEKGTSWT